MSETVKIVQKLVDIAMRIPRYTYPMFENAARPDVEEFASVRAIHERNPGFDERKTIEGATGEVTVRISSARVVILEILFTRGTSAVTEFISSFYRQEVLDHMKATNLTVLQHKPIENETLTLESNWEIRHGVYLECMSIQTYEYTEATVGSVGITSRFDDIDLGTIIGKES